MSVRAVNTWQSGRWKWLAVGIQVVLFLVVVAGVVARLVGLPLYTPDSGDEWGNTIAPFRVLFEHGNPGLFFHPSLYYYVTAAVYAALFAVLKLTGAVDGSLSMTDLFVLDERYFVFAARAVSVLSAALAMWALYALGKSLWDRQAGLMAAALLAVLPLHAVYSEAVRVDSLFLPVFIYAFSRIVRILQHPDRAAYDKAGFLTGLATGTNYNGAVLALWLIAAHLLQSGDGRANDLARDPSRQAGDTRSLGRALGLSVVGFVLSSPFLFIDFETSIQYIAFISGLSLAQHPGMEGRGFLFYVEEMARMHPYLFVVIGLSSLAIAWFGNRTERFVLSLPVGYLLLFSLVGTKFDRFILPAMALFLLVAGGLPFVLARRFAARRWAAVGSRLVSYALLFVCLATMAPGAIPIPQHEMLARPDGVLLAWIERNARPRSNILIESGILPLIDTTLVPGRFAAAVRGSLVAMRPGLDHEFISAVYVGGRSNYEPGVLAAKRIDYAVISPRTVRYIESRCDALPDICAFYRELRAAGSIAFETPEGLEPAVVYAVRPVASTTD